MKQYDVIIKPLLTEKSYSDVANKKYAFIIFVTKYLIKKIKYFMNQFKHYKLEILHFL